ncbi:transglutaminase family protein [Microbacterium arborescens]
MPSRAELSRTGDTPLAAVLLLSIVAAILPLLRVVAAGTWLVVAVAVAAAVLLVGVGLRRLHLPAVVVTLAELVTAGALVTAVYFGDTALLLVIPTPGTFAEVPSLITGASGQIINGVAPLTADRPLAVLAVTAVAALTVLLDHTVITARMPLLAAIALVAVWLIPALSVPAPVDLIAFVVFAAAVLLLIRTETRSRERALARSVAAVSATEARQRGEAEPRRRRSRSGAVLAAGLAVTAIVATVIVVPELPRPAPRIGIGTGPATTINASLELGDDLRRPTDVEVLTTRTNAPSMPYLRAATLSSFDGRVWEPDRDETTPLTPEALGPVVADPDVRVTEYQTTVSITQLSSAWLPVPGPAVRVDDLSGGWEAMPSNRTVVAADTDTQGQEYVTTTHVVRPTLEQIQAAGTTTDGLPDTVTQLPADMPASIERTAREVTAGAENDYDRLAALQRWFRSAEFTYSLDAPVSDGFDGSGVDAIADFLEVRSGYCVHFASAFAVMARTLDMPSRIVVGYLPGTLTGRVADGESVATVLSSQLHAWPEVYFAGIGWVPFEPTNSLGTPASYARSAQPLPDDGGQDVTPAPAPQQTATVAPDGGPTPTPTTSTGPSAGSEGSPLALVLPYGGVVLGFAALVLLPALLGAARRRWQTTAAERGDVLAAWRIVRESARDVGLRVDDAESPRALGIRLAAMPTVPDERVDALVAAVERTSYDVPDSERDAAGGRAAASDALAVRRGLLASVSTPRRISAVLLPRFLVRA